MYVWIYSNMILHLCARAIVCVLCMYECIHVSMYVCMILHLIYGRLNGCDIQKIV